MVHNLVCEYQFTFIEIKLVAFSKSEISFTDLILVGILKRNNMFCLYFVDKFSLLFCLFFFLVYNATKANKAKTARQFG